MLRAALFTAVAVVSGLRAGPVAEWPAVALDAHVSVQFPAAPRHIEGQQLKQVNPAMEHADLYAVADTSGTYMVLRVDQGATGMEPITPAGRGPYYNGVVDAMVADFKGELLSRTPFTVGQYDGVEFALKGTRPGAAGPPAVQYVRSLLIGQISYALMYTPRDGRGLHNAAQRTAFFQSLQVK